MNQKTQTLIVGAGPFGLGQAAYFQQRHHDYIIVGKPMEFWEHHMPKGMLLRSNANWYLDPNDEWTIERYFAEYLPTVSLTEPISRENYIGYMNWFVEQAGIAVFPHYVNQLNKDGDYFTAELDNGDTIQAQQVILATGFQYFAFCPTNLISLLPAGRYQHSCDAVHMDAYRDKRVLLIGGRQSAFESAALLCEAGAAHVHISYRHDTPRFEEADWTWVEAIVERMTSQPEWFRELPPAQQEKYRYQLWAEGRLKVEAWLEDRVHRHEVTMHPRTEVMSVSLKSDHALKIRLDSGDELEVDDVMLATGYQVDVRRLPFLGTSIRNELVIRNGFPALDLQFQSSVPGLYFTSFPAGQAFGPFFGFTVAVRTAAKLIGSALC